MVVTEAETGTTFALGLASVSDTLDVAMVTHSVMRVGLLDHGIILVTSEHPLIKPSGSVLITNASVSLPECPRV